MDSGAPFSTWLVVIISLKPIDSTFQSLGVNDFLANLQPFMKDAEENLGTGSVFFRQCILRAC